jgi:hypothetical protein
LDVEVCNNHEQDFLLASEQHPSTSYITYMGKASGISGDGRGDSPGYSAKYGCLGVFTATAAATS